MADNRFKCFQIWGIVDETKTPPFCWPSTLQQRVAKHHSTFFFPSVVDFLQLPVGDLEQPLVFADRPGRVQPEEVQHRRSHRQQRRTSHHWVAPSIGLSGRADK